MSVSYIKQSVKNQLWGKSAGRCQYEGCNKPLWLDGLTKKYGNFSYIAHIVADKPDGPRGDSILSEKLKSDLSNLMLLCDTHHREIDIVDVKGHSIERLRRMKRDHEHRVKLVTGIVPESQSHVLLYGANIGNVDSPLSFNRTSLAMLNSTNSYPADEHPIEIGIKNNVIKDSTTEFWMLQETNLVYQFDQKVKSRIASGEIRDLSVFGLAAQPLLIKLGTLISDLVKTSVFQLHREPDLSWEWLNRGNKIEYKIYDNGKPGDQIGLILSLSATVNVDRAQKVLGKDAPIWTLTHENPGNDYLNDKQHLSDFRTTIRKLFDMIKAKHGEEASIHIFPAMPIAAAIELGRVWMPKADLPLIIYDQNKGNGKESKAGFYKSISIS